VTAEVLVLGGSGSGKTHFAGQLITRMRHDPNSTLALEPGGIDDLGKLEEVLSCLSEGRSAGHTPAGTWVQISCRLRDAGGGLGHLHWPDFAGEHTLAVTQSRALPQQWRGMVETAQGWMLFIRPRRLSRYEDLITRPPGLAPRPAERPRETPTSREWDDAARYVELLQILLAVGRYEAGGPVQAPRLAVMLSCWDELQSPDTPRGVLASCLPLLSSFVETNWAPGRWRAWGLSSLGRSLDESRTDAEFAALGPENCGYVILHDGTQKHRDLTLPVAELLSP